MVIETEEIEMNTKLIKAKQIAREMLGENNAPALFNWVVGLLMWECEEDLDRAIKELPRD